MAKIEYKSEDLLYPKDPQELLQRVFSLTKIINLYLDKNDPDYESKVNAIATIKAEILRHHRDQNTETTIISDWKNGLDLLRNEIQELREQRRKPKK